MEPSSGLRTLNPFIALALPATDRRLEGKSESKRLDLPFWKLRSSVVISFNVFRLVVICHATPSLMSPHQPLYVKNRLRR